MLSKTQPNYFSFICTHSVIFLKTKIKIKNIKKTIQLQLLFPHKLKYFLWVYLLTLFIFYFCIPY